MSDLKSDFYRVEFDNNLFFHSLNVQIQIFCYKKKKKVQRAIHYPKKKLILNKVESNEL